MRRVLLVSLVVGCGSAEPGTESASRAVGGDGGSQEMALGGSGAPAAGSSVGGSTAGGAGAASGGTTTAGPTGGSGSWGPDMGGGGHLPTAGMGGSASTSAAGMASTTAGAAGSTTGPKPVGSPCDCYQLTLGKNRYTCSASLDPKGFTCGECPQGMIDCDGDTVEATVGSGCEVHAEYCPP